MKRNTRMFLAANSKPERREWDEDRRAEMRYKDDRGREHYDNGRYAPARSEMNPPYSGTPNYNVEINRYENRGSHPERWRMRPDDREGTVRMIGFDGDYVKTDPGKKTASNVSVFPGCSKAATKMDEHDAREWMAHLENEDGTTGPHWTMEQIRHVMDQRGMTGDPVEMWTAMNMMYSDYCKVAKKMGVNTMDFYAEMAKAFLDDKDAGADDKLSAYYEYVVKT